MVNYGYDQNTPKWKGSRKKMLAIFLSRVLKYPIGYTGNGKPYIEIDELYSGVRIRKITDLTETELKTMTKKADQTYDTVMDAEDVTK